MQKAEFERTHIDQVIEWILEDKTRSPCALTGNGASRSRVNTQLNMSVPETQLSRLGGWHSLFQSLSENPWAWDIVLDDLKFNYCNIVMVLQSFYSKGHDPRDFSDSLVKTLGRWLQSIDLWASVDKESGYRVAGALLSGSGAREVVTE